MNHQLVKPTDVPGFKLSLLKLDENGEWCCTIGAQHYHTRLVPVSTYPTKFPKTLWSKVEILHCNEDPCSTTAEITGTLHPDILEPESFKQLTDYLRTEYGGRTQGAIQLWGRWSLPSYLSTTVLEKIASQIPEDHTMVFQWTYYKFKSKAQPSSSTPNETS